MNDLQIYTLIAKKPGIRAVQISDALDQPLTAVSQALRPLVDIGNVVQSKGIAPNGYTAQVYELSDEFKRSREGLAVMALIEPPSPAIEPAPASVPAPAPVAPEPAPAPAVASLAVPVQTPASLAPPELGRTGSALAFIAKHGSATDPQLRAVMRLTSTGYPATFLRTAIKGGRVHRDGDLWKLGSVKSALEQIERDHQPAATVTAEEVKGLPEAVIEQMSKPARVLAAAPNPVPAQTGTPSPHRCAIWSDGTFEVQTDGKTVATLNMDQTAALIEFVERIGAPA